MNTADTYAGRDSWPRGARPACPNPSGAGGPVSLCGTPATQGGQTLSCRRTETMSAETTLAASVTPPLPNPPSDPPPKYGMISWKFLTKDFDIVLHNCCGRFAENCEDLRRLTFSHVKLPTNIAEICGDDESAQKLRRKYKSPGM